MGPWLCAPCLGTSSRDAVPKGVLGHYRCCPAPGSVWDPFGTLPRIGGLWASPVPRGDPMSSGQAHGRRLAAARARENVPGIPNISRRAHRSLRLLLGLSHAAAGTASSNPDTFRGAAGRVLLGWLPSRSRQRLQGFSTAGWAQTPSTCTVTGLTSLPRARGDRQLLPTAQHAAPPRAPRAAAPGLWQARPRGWPRRWVWWCHPEGTGGLQHRVVRARGCGEQGGGQGVLWGTGDESGEPQWGPGEQGLGDKVSRRSPGSQH